MENPAMIELPEKAYFKIGEVAKFLDVESYVLRYWETEFDELEPEKTKSGQRVYQRSDIELLFQIRTLLYEEMFTIAGARRQLERSRSGESSFFDLQGESSTRGLDGSAVAEAPELREELQETRRELARAQTDLMEVQEREEQARLRAASLEEELLTAQEGRREAETRAQASGPEKMLVVELQEEVSHLEAALVRVREEAEEDRLKLRRGHADREGHRKAMLSALRREVEGLAALAEPGRNRA